MASYISYTMANQFLRSLNGQGGAIYIGLSLENHDPGRDGSGCQEPPSANGYRRIRLYGDQMSPPETGTTTNSATIYFAEATASWGTCKYFCLFSSETAAPSACLVAYGELNPAITPVANTVPLIRAGDLEMTM